MSERLCEPRPESGLLSHRTPALVDRDARLYSVMVRTTVQGNVMGEPRTAPSLSHDQLLAGLASDTTISAFSAAFVAGRSTTSNTEDDAATLAALESLVGSMTPGNLRNKSQVYVDGVMSLALLGQVDASRDKLSAVVKDPAREASAGYLAAYYLAQFGDPSGYPFLHEELTDRKDGHGRMMAVRHLIAFVPFDGQNVDGLTIDIRGEYLARLSDRDSDVAAAVPSLMVEADLADITDELKAATKRPFPKVVRETAEEALAELAAR